MITATKALLPAAVFGLVFGAIANAGPIDYVASLSGAAESPVNNSPGTGFTVVTYDNTAHTLRVVANFSGLSGTTTASHIHCCTLPTAGVATVTPNFTGFPLGVTSGSYDRLFDLTLASSWNPAFVTAQGSIANAEAALANGLNAGVAYLNIHSSTFGGGEIRGFLVATPEPSSGLLLLAPALAFWVRRRRARRA
jgi:hypothetical protein